MRCCILYSFRPALHVCGKEESATDEREYEADGECEAGMIQVTLCSLCRYEL